MVERALRACLVGPGRAGGSLALAWQAVGVLRFDAVLARTPAHPVAALLGCPGVDDVTAIPPVDLWVIATPDDRITDVAQRIATALPAGTPGCAVHLSGFLASAALAPLHDIGFAVASGHPLRSFPALDTELAFESTWCALEGDAVAVACLERLFCALDGQCFALDADAKTAYHGAAVLAGNAIVGLADSAISSWVAAGLPEATARAVFADLAGGVVENIASAGTAEALSGPVRRGDFGTVEAHVAELDARDPGAAEVYRALSKRLLTLVSDLDRDTVAKLERLLS